MACADCMRPDLAGFDDATLMGVTFDDVKVVAIPSLGTGLFVGALTGLIWQSPKVGLVAGGVVAGLTAVGLSLFTMLIKGMANG